MSTPKFRFFNAVVSVLTRVMTPVIIAVLGSAALLSAGPLGIFQGEVVAGPSSGIVFVKGKNGSLRRVQLGTAKIRFDNNIPLSERSDDPARALQRGAIVRVTAEQDAHGEW